jgi:hypothetical protein
MKKLFPSILIAFCISVSSYAAVDLLSFGSGTFSIDPGSTAATSQSASGITMNTNPALGDTWYNDTMSPLTNDWSGFPSFALRMTALTNPGLTYTITLFDESFNMVNVYDGSTVGLTSVPSLSPLALNNPGTGILSSIHYVQFTWGGGGSPINTEVTEFVGVPEPSTYALLAVGGIALAGHLIRRRRRA